MSAWPQAPLRRGWVELEKRRGEGWDAQSLSERLHVRMVFWDLGRVAWGGGGHSHPHPHPNNEKNEGRCKDIKLFCPQQKALLNSQTCFRPHNNED